MRVFRGIMTLWFLAGMTLTGNKVALGNSLQGFFSSSSHQYENVLVERVISADTIRLVSGEKIRLIGIRAPEAPRRKTAERDKFGFIIEEDNPLTSVDERAFDFVRSLLEEKFVRLEFDTRKKDSAFATLAYVFMVGDQTFVNAEILRQGFASLRIRPPNTKYADRLREAYQEARREKRGLQGE